MNTCILITTREVTTSVKLNGTIPCLGHTKPCLGQTHVKLYTPFRTKRPKTIPCPAAHTCVGHIREYPLCPPPPFPCPGITLLQTNLILDCQPRNQNRCFVLLVNCFLLLLLFGDLLVLFQVNTASLEQASGHNHKKRMSQPGRFPYNCITRIRTHIHSSFMRTSRLGLAEL